MERNRNRIITTAFYGICGCIILAIVGIVLNRHPIDRLYAPLGILIIGWYLGRPMIAAVITHIQSSNLTPEQRAEVINEDALPSVTVQMPAYNEETNIRSAVRSVVEQAYPGEMELIVVDDGSTDDTWEILQQLEEKYGELRTFTQENAGIGPTRNRALAEGTGEVVVTMDSDTVLEPGALLALIRPFRDGDVVGVASNCEVKNESENLWTKAQSIEYLLSMEMSRMFQSRFRHLMVISGGCGAYRRSVLERLGGWQEHGNFYAEDFDMTIRATEFGEVQFAQYGLALTVVPSTLREWWEQRIMWAGRGLRTVFKNKRSWLNPEFSWLGLFAMPFKLVTTLYLVWAIATALFTVITSGSPIAGLSIIGVGYGMLLSSTIALSLFTLMIVSAYSYHHQPLQNVGVLPVYLLIYRQLHILVRICAFSWVTVLYIISVIRNQTLNPVLSVDDE